MNLKRLWIVLTAVGLSGCAALQPTPYPEPQQINRLFPASVILLGEQHDAADHQRIHRFMVETLAARHALAALALEMASEGQSTEKLGTDASEEAVKDALKWSQGTWSWSVYGSVVMAAVRAGVPVVGANLPKARMRESMNDTGFDALLPAAALQTQQQNIRQGHCSQLPEPQVAPMARIQIARDIAMARTLVKLVQPGKTVLLVAGSGHVDKTLGIAQHLPPDLKIKTVLMHGDPIANTDQYLAQFDEFWPTRPAPKGDHCADFLAQRKKAATTEPVVK
jgi:uncharacterized iron-regulated protein